jgi:hypothetical protein
MSPVSWKGISMGEVKLRKIKRNGRLVVVDENNRTVAHLSLNGGWCVFYKHRLLVGTRPAREPEAAIYQNLPLTEA